VHIFFCIFYLLQSSPCACPSGSGIVPLILNLSSSGRSAVNSMQQPFYHQRKSPPGTHWIGGWVGTRVSVDTLDTRKTSCPQGIQPRFFHHLAHSKVTVLTMLVWRVKKLFILLKHTGKNNFSSLFFNLPFWRHRKWNSDKQVFIDVPRFSFSPSTITNHSTFTNVLSLR